MNSLDAAQARKDIDAIAQRARAFHAYATMGPALAVWGGVWLAMFLPRAAQWPAAGSISAVALVIGVAVSILTGVRSRRPAPTGPRAQGVGAVFGALLLAITAIVAPLDAQAAGAIVGLTVAAAYGVAGVIAAPRLAGLGLVLAVVILGAWFGLRPAFDLVLGLAGGGALIAGGLWLWRQ